MTPSAFFLQHVPALGLLRARAFPALQQRICVVVEHEAFTLDLHAEGDDAHPRARAGGDPRAPFQLYLSRAAFDRLIAGTLDADDAIAKKQVGFRGDVRVLAQLGRLIAGAGSSVDVRTGLGARR
jgi:hypothetical protein